MVARVSALLIYTRGSLLTWIPLPRSPSSCKAMTRSNSPFVWRSSGFLLRCGVADDPAVIDAVGAKVSALGASFPVYGR